MNDYTGKQCPYCKTAFRPGDDIVVCSECDMPHHKDCWVENRGCTTFGCLGTIKAADGAASSVTTSHMHYEDPRSAATGSFVFCTQCGTKNAGTSFFCSHCGNRLVTAHAPQATAYAQANPANGNPYSYANQRSNAYQAQGNYQASGHQNYQGCQSCQPGRIDPILQRLIGTKAEYYLPKFQVMKSQNKITSWNWPAFLVTPYWMIYRKMYGYGFALLGVALLVFLIDAYFLSLLTLAGYIVLGIFGNNIYMRHLEAKADQARSMAEPFQSQFIVKNSGTNTLATVLSLIGFFLLIGILF